MIRKATKADASRLAEILIFAKRTSYRPIFQADEVSFNEMTVLDLALRYRDAAKRSWSRERMHGFTDMKRSLGNEVDVKRQEMFFAEFEVKELERKDVLINSVMGLCGESGEAIDFVKKWMAHSRLCPRGL